MKGIRLLALCLGVVFLTNGCLVTKKTYDKLLREKTALDIERQKLKNELSDIRTEKGRKIAELNSRITTLEQEIMDMRTKYEEYVKVTGGKQEELANSLQILRDQSSKERKILLNQVKELREKCDSEKKAKDKQIDALKAMHRVEPLTLDGKKTLEDLFDQLEQQLQEQIERGEIRLKRYKTKIK